MLLQSFAPASVVTNLKGDILYVHGDTGKYLRPAPGQASLNVVEMAREGLELELRTAVARGQPRHADAEPGNTGQDQRWLSVCQPQRPALAGLRGKSEPAAGELSGRGAGGAPQAQRGKAHHRIGRTGRIEELERELAYTKENLQATIEEQQASNEELKSTNEEMQSTNEELQSTNEELETSKEELQSVNEELITRQRRTPGQDRAAGRHAE